MTISLNMIVNFRKLFPSFRKISQCSRTFSNVKNDLKTEYDAIVVGAGNICYLFISLRPKGSLHQLSTSALFL